VQEATLQQESIASQHKKKQQETVNELMEQIDQLNKAKAK
jgi:hypothetical protein